mmetsp:Transcript_11104/g.22124  ORF Transcript_11104/g.22124 Transcript_11104/m.22124 type:complete len:274 (-) Transcript_11104:101-922(-)
MGHGEKGEVGVVKDDREAVGDVGDDHHRAVEGEHARVLAKHHGDAAQRADCVGTHEHLLPQVSVVSQATEADEDEELKHDGDHGAEETDARVTGFDAEEVDLLGFKLEVRGPLAIICETRGVGVAVPLNAASLECAGPTLLEVDGPFVVGAGAAEAFLGLIQSLVLDEDGKEVQNAVEESSVCEVVHEPAIELLRRRDLGLLVRIDVVPGNAHPSGGVDCAHLPAGHKLLLKGVAPSGGSGHAGEARGRSDRDTSRVGERRVIAVTHVCNWDG